MSVINCSVMFWLLMLCMLVRNIVVIFLIRVRYCDGCMVVRCVYSVLKLLRVVFLICVVCVVIFLLDSGVGVGGRLWCW